MGQCFSSPAEASRLPAADKDHGAKVTTHQPQPAADRAPAGVAAADDSADVGPQQPAAAGPRPQEAPKAKQTQDSPWSKLNASESAAVTQTLLKVRLCAVQFGCRSALLRRQCCCPIRGCARRLLLHSARDCQVVWRLHLQLGSNHNCGVCMAPWRHPRVQQHPRRACWWPRRAAQLVARAERMRAAAFLPPVHRRSAS